MGNLKSRRSSAFFQHPRRCYFHASLQRSVEYIIIDSREKWIKFFSSSKVHSLAFFQSLSFVVSDKVFQYLINRRLGSVKRESKTIIQIEEVEMENCVPWMWRPEENKKGSWFVFNYCLWFKYWHLIWDEVFFTFHIYIYINFEFNREILIQWIWYW